MPGPPFRSKLEPFLDFITLERRKRSTWKAIAEAIKEQGTACTPQGVQDYFRRRRKPGRRVPAGFEETPVPEISINREPRLDDNRARLDQIRARAKETQESQQTKAQRDPTWDQNFEAEKI